MKHIFYFIFGLFILISDILRYSFHILWNVKFIRWDEFIVKLGNRGQQFKTHVYNVQTKAMGDEPIDLWRNRDDVFVRKLNELTTKQETFYFTCYRLLIKYKPY